ncbi:hypothetical protein NZK32_02225 [Cyanobium sp. FGCU-52]|nr:hypothetical protein [Cyanobium sp. FGCU52]
MNDHPDESVQDELNDLIREMEESDGAKDHSEKAARTTQDASHFASMLFFLSLVGMMCMGLGFWVGQSTAKIAQSQGSLSRDHLVSAQQGWRAEGSGVFYRWCRGECHAPKLYGGGVSQVFEVRCADRPCGDLHMRFNVLNAQGQPIDQIVLKERGLQGELRRFIVESQDQAAVSIELSEFNARARI